MHFNERTMPANRPTPPKLTLQELPWQGRLYALRVIFTTMVLVMLAVSDWSCRNQPGGHFWLILFGAAYPHLGYLLLGRFEGRGRRGYTVLVIDGLFCGAVMAAIGLASPPSAVLAAINLFNWMVVGGPTLAGFGLTAALAGIALSGLPDISPSPSACMASDALAGFLLIGYFLVVGRFIHHHGGKLRQQHLNLQAESDVATRARKLADQALMSMLPRSASEVLAAKGELPPETLEGATVLLVEFSWDRSQSPTIGDLADCFQIADAVISRHGFECIKTFGRRYLAMSRGPKGPDDAINATREVNNYLLDHRSLPDSRATQCSVRAFVHCGTLVAGLVQPSRLNFELLGEPIGELEALAANSSELPTDAIVASVAAYRRVQNKLDFIATPTGSDGKVYLFRVAPSS